MGKKSQSTIPEYGVGLIGYLPLGRGHLGGPEYAVTDQHEIQDLRLAAAQALGPYSVAGEVHCMDARTLAQLRAVRRRQSLHTFRAPTWAGGLGLASTKAVLGANAKVVKGAATMADAYERAVDRLQKAGWRDAGHAFCGATGKAEASMVDRLPAEIVAETLDGVGFLAPHDRGRLERIERNKRHLMGAHPDFFEGWGPDQHRALVESTSPGRYAEVVTADDGHNGHTPAALLVVEGGAGLAKNAFNQATGRMLLSVTPDVVAPLADALGDTPQERRLIAAAFKDDLIQVSHQLVTPPHGLPGQEGFYAGLPILHASPRA